VIVAPRCDGCVANSHHQGSGEKEGGNPINTGVQTDGAHDDDGSTDRSDNDLLLNRGSPLPSEAVAVVVRGGCSFAQKAAVAQAQGFAALLIIDPVLSLTDIEGTWRAPGTVPAVPAATTASAASAASAIAGDGSGGYATTLGDHSVSVLSGYDGILQTPMIGGTTSEASSVIIPVIMTLGLQAVSSVSTSLNSRSQRVSSSWAALCLKLAHEAQLTLIDVASAVGALEPDAAAHLAEGFGVA